MVNEFRLSPLPSDRPQYSGAAIHAWKRGPKARPSSLPLAARARRAWHGGDRHGRSPCPSTCSLVRSAESARRGGRVARRSNARRRPRGAAGPSARFGQGKLEMDFPIGSPWTWPMQSLTCSPPIQGRGRIAIPLPHAADLPCSVSLRRLRLRQPPYGRRTGPRRRPVAGGLPAPRFTRRSKDRGRALR